MAFTLEELTQPLTHEEIKASIYQILATVGVNTTTWKPGAVVRTMIAAVAIVLAAFSRLTAAIAKSGFLELAEADWLTLVAKYVYGVNRIEATFATGTVTLTNSGGGVYNEDADDVILTNTTTGKTYRVSEAFSLGAFTTLDVAVVAIEAGSASTAAAGAIDDLETPLIGVTCSNAVAVVGRDAELDPALRARCAEKLGSLSPNGPWDAYSFAVRNAVRTDGSSIGVTRTRITRDGLGNVYVYVATATGGVTGTATDISTDLGILQDAVLRLAEPLAITAFVISASPLVLSITYQLWMYNTSGLTTTQVESAILAKLVTFMAGQPIGGNIIGSADGAIFQDAIKAAISNAAPEIFHVVVSSPATTTVDLTIDQVAMLGAVTATSIVQSSPNEGAY